MLVVDEKNLRSGSNAREGESIGQLDPRPDYYASSGPFEKSLCPVGFAKGPLNKVETIPFENPWIAGYRGQSAATMALAVLVY